MENSQKEPKTEQRTWEWETEEAQQEWEPRDTRWKREAREEQPEWQPKDPRGKWEPEYLPQEMLREAGLDDEKLAIEDVRYELYVSESEIVAMRGRLKQLEREYDKLRSSKRTSTIMSVICLLTLLFALSLQKMVVQAGKSMSSPKSEETELSSGQSAGTNLSADQLPEGELSIDQMMETRLLSAAGAEDVISVEKIVFAVVAAFSTVLLVVSVAGLCWFGYKAIYGHYRYFREGESEQAKALCQQEGRSNLSDEIFSMQIQITKKEKRIMRLKQLRTIYRENQQQNWRETKPQKSIYDE